MPNIEIEYDGATATIFIDRPEKLNALNIDMVQELEASVREVEYRDGVRVVILTGKGEKSFCAGGDIESWSEYSPYDFGRDWIRRGHEVFNQIARLSQPVIAVLNGHVLGGGLELAACADYRIGEKHIRIGQPEGALGIIPGWSGTQRTVRRFGSQVIRRMAMFGEIFTAEESIDLGLIDKLVDNGEGLAAAKDLAQKICERSQVSTELVKMLINAAEDEDSERAYEVCAGIVAAGSPELQEGLKAFRECRKPEFGNVSKK